MKMKIGLLTILSVSHPPVLDDRPIVDGNDLWATSEAGGLHNSQMGRASRGPSVHHSHTYTEVLY